MFFHPMPKLKVIRDSKYLEWIKSKPCVDHDQRCYGDIVPAHQNVPIPSSAKGTSQKNHDIWALQIHQSKHLLEHNGLYQIKNKELHIVKNLLEYKPEIARDVLEYITRKWEK